MYDSDRTKILGNSSTHDGNKVATRCVTYEGDIYILQRRKANF